MGRLSFLITSRQVRCGAGSWLHQSGVQNKDQTRYTNLGGISMLLISKAIGLDEITKGVREDRKAKFKP